MLMEPISVCPGLDRYREWREAVEPRQRGLVERAAEGYRRRGYAEPLTVHDADPVRAEGRERRAAGFDERAGMGPIRYGPSSPILSAR
jgi:hypothetical protein